MSRREPGADTRRAANDLARPLSALPDPLPVPPLPPGRTVRLTLRPPGSKSLTNRALVLAGLAAGSSTLRHALLDADDTLRMIDALRALGAQIALAPPDQITVTGLAGRWNPTTEPVVLHAGDAGTVARFLAAAAILSPLPVTIDGSARLRQRPMGQLADVLRTLGAVVESDRLPAALPIRIRPPSPLPRAATVSLPRLQSSQFLSALLLVAPALPGGLTIRLDDRPPSAPYVAMTLRLLDQLGATVRVADGQRVIRVGPTAPDRPRLDPFELHIEPDASAATYFWAAAALLPGSTCRVVGLTADSLQGDSAFVQLLARMGAHTRVADQPDDGIAVQGTHRLEPVLADMADMPDAAVTLAVLAAFAAGPSVVRGLDTLRLKESDRIAALQHELARIDVRVDVGVRRDRGAITISPPPGGIDCSRSAPPVTFETYRDHRIAMALALVGLRRPNVFIRDPACIAKTYPRFWADLARLYA